MARFRSPVSRIGTIRAHKGSGNLNPGRSTRAYGYPLGRFLSGRWDQILAKELTSWHRYAELLES